MTTLAAIIEHLDAIAVGLGELTEGQHRIEAALGMVRSDVATLKAEVAEIRRLAELERRDCKRAAGEVP